MIVAVVIVLSLVVVGLVITQVDSSQQVSSSSNSLGLSTQVIGVTESLISPSDGNFVVKLLNNSGEFITISNVSVGDRNVAFSEDLAQGSSKLFKVVADSNCTLGKVVSSDVVITYVTVDGLSKVVRYPSKVMFDCSPFVITQANLANQCPSCPTMPVYPGCTGGVDAACAVHTGTNYTASTYYSVPVVTDASTNLMWKKCSQGLSGTTCGTGSATTESQPNAVTDCLSLNTGGATGWRLPTLSELRTIVDFSAYNPAINTTYFPGTPINNGSSWSFWVSTLYYPMPTYGYGVRFSDGTESSVDDFSYLRFVRCVRSP